MHLLSAFSINMLDFEYNEHNIHISKMTEEEVRMTLEDTFKSCIGHESTATALSERLDLAVDFNRTVVTLSDEDVAIVAQLPRPREGQIYTRKEIENMNIDYYYVQIE